MEYNEEEYVHEYVPEGPQYGTKFLSVKRKPNNTLDYLKYKSEEYLQWKLKEKIIGKINLLKLSDKYINEIYEICERYYKKIDVRISDIISIVTYKVIKKYNLHISHSELFEKLELDKSKYLKHANKITLGNTGMIESTNDEEMLYTYSKNLYNNITYMMNRLADYYKQNPKSFKLQSEEQIDRILEEVRFKFNYNKDSDLVIKNTKGIYSDVINLMEESKIEAKDMVYDNSFYQSFNNKILNETLTAGLIKYLLKKRGVVVNLKTFKELFNVSPSSISKSIKLILEFNKININKNKFY